jgi:uncharacterized membrane protein
VTSYWSLLGVAVVVVGFAAKLNAALVVVTAGLVSGFAAGKSIGELLELLGTEFATNRALLLFTLTLPVIGVLERAGLRERARTWILGFTRLTLSRLLIAYMFLRETLAMVGLISVAGHAQTVRPLLAPMAEATATRSIGALDRDARDRIRAMAAGTDNIGVFFGEDVFLAFGAVVLIKEFFDGQGIRLDPVTIGLWALPTAITAFAIHAVRIVLFERGLRAQLARSGAAALADAPPAPPPPPPGEER